MLRAFFDSGKYVVSLHRQRLLPEREVMSGQSMPANLPKSNGVQRRLRLAAPPLRKVTACVATQCHRDNIEKIEPCTSSFKALFISW